MVSLLWIAIHFELSFICIPLEARKADGAGSPVTGINRAAERVSEVTLELG